MKDTDFPALYRSANRLSLQSQGRFFCVLKLHLTLLIIAATLSVLDIPHWTAATAQAAVLLGALACAIYLALKRPEKFWYSGRAVAESIKTVTWRFMCRAEPFQLEMEAAQTEFGKKLSAIIEQNKDIAQQLTQFLANPQVTATMTANRNLELEDRKSLYATERIADQLEWYAGKAAAAKTNSSKFFLALVLVNAAAVLMALVRIRFPEASNWPTDIAITAAASVLGWMQAKRFDELSASYALAAHEIGLIGMQSINSYSERQFSDFVGDTENAFSREHTQWVARKDV